MLYRTEDIIKALEETHGQIYLAADVLGCSHMTIYRRAEKVKAVQDTISKFRGVLVDKAVLALERGVLKGEQWAVTFTLSRLGKDRGYVERQELSVDISQVDDAIERQLERLAPPGES